MAERSIGMESCLVVQTATFSLCMGCLRRMFDSSPLDFRRVAQLVEQFMKNVNHVRGFHSNLLRERICREFDSPLSGFGDVAELEDAKV